MVSEWGYPGIAAAMQADADEVMPIITVYEMGQEKSPGTTVTTPEQALSWAPPEYVTADDLSRDEILEGAFGSK